MEMHFRKSDFVIQWFSGTGAGGQHRNKHQNCCRIIHIKSRLMATGQSHRERPANQKEAFNKLAGMLLAHYGDPPDARRGSNEVVRTYHAERAVVTDGFTELPFRDVMNGDLDEFLRNGLKGNRPRRQTGRGG